MANNSIYTPAGTADRWLFTPQITLDDDNSVLTWDAKTVLFAAAGADAYEVYIATSIAGATPAPSDFSSTAVYTNAGEATDWTARDVDLATYSSGDDIYIAFRHVSTNQQAIGVDNIYVGASVLNDMEATTSVLYNSVTGYYGLIPQQHASPVAFSQNVANAGSNDQTNVVLETKVNDGTSDVFTGTSTAVTVAGGEVDSLVIPTQFTIGAGSNSYEVAYAITQTEDDETLLNNNDTVRFATDDNMYARAYNATSILSPANLVALGAADGLVVANNFSFIEDHAIEVITMQIYTGTEPGVIFTGKLYDASDMSEIGTTDPHTITAADVTGGMISIAFASPINISAGTIVVAGMEMTYGQFVVNFLCDASSTSEPRYNNFYLPNATGGAAWTSINGTGTPVIFLSLTDFLSVENNITETNINIYPNPTTGIVNITNAENAVINVYNTIGSLVKTVSNTNTVNLSNLENGTYIVKITTNNNTIVKNIVLTK